MKVLATLTLVPALAPLPASAEGVNPLLFARELADAGAFQLVLDRVSRFQPRDRAAATWNDWEALRCRALDALGRHGELAERAALLPAAALPDALTPCMSSAARALFASGRHAEARRYAARALWHGRLPAAEMQTLRRLTIDAYVAERRGEEAYRAMLRYQQDYGPLPRDVAAQFAMGLVALRMDKEALAWLPQLDDSHPARLALRVRAGLMPAEAAVAQARAALARGADPAPWTVLADAVSGAEQSSLRMALYEQSLNRPAVSESAAAAAARELWAAYMAAASDIANRSRLLVGDDAGWADYAGRRLGSEPVTARALFAHLSQRAQSAATRYNAQLQLLHSYESDRLGRVALRLFEAVFPDVDALDTQVRYRLGATAERAGAAAAVLRYWRDLPPPPDTSAGEWLVRLSRERWRAGHDDIGIDALVRHYAEQKTPAGAAVQQAIRYAEELVEAGRYAAGRSLSEALMSHVPPAQSQALHATLARAHEGVGEHALAAESYLRAALPAGNTPDAAAAHARLRAGAALARAGYARDARAQLEWVAGHAKDPAMAEAARRELARLQP